MSRPACLLCAETERAALVRIVVCREHLAALQGHSSIESHHPVGKANGSDTVPLSANVHAILTQEMAAWLLALRTPDASPLLQIARVIQALMDFASWFLKNARRTPAYLAALDALLKEKDPEWWEHTDIAPLKAHDD